MNNIKKLAKKEIIEPSYLRNYVTIGELRTIQKQNTRIAKAKMKLYEQRKKN